MEADAPLEDRSPSGRRRGRRLFFIITSAVLIAILVAVGLIWWTVQSKLNRLEIIDQAFPSESLRPAPPRPEDGKKAPMNILLLGSDSRADTSDSLLSDIGNRADTIMVAHISGDRKSVQIMSIMRDSWVEVPGHGEMKINGALAYGGVPLMVQTVEGLIDQRIDHVAVIDFNGFRGITDALGGVTLNNPREFNASPPVNTHFPAGEITLSGEDALAFVRERKTFAAGDYDRVANQQLFLKAMASQILSRDTLTNPGKLNNLLDTTVDYVATDGGFGLGTMIDLGTSMSSVRDRDITSFTMPTNGTGMVGDQSVVLVNWDELDTLRDKFAKDDLADYKPAAHP